MTTLPAWERLARVRGPITVGVLAEHADRTARSLDVIVEFAERDYVRGLRRVFGPSIRDDQSYARRLHELGHTQTRSAEAHGVTVHLSGTHVANSSGEAAAWRWARQRALCWSAAMEAEKDRCLASYERYARHGLADPIWQELERIDGQLTLGHARHQLATAGRPSIDALRERLNRVT